MIFVGLLEILLNAVASATSLCGLRVATQRIADSTRNTVPSFLPFCLIRGFVRWRSPAPKRRENPKHRRIEANHRDDLLLNESAVLPGYKRWRKRQRRASRCQEMGSRKRGGERTHASSSVNSRYCLQTLHNCGEFVVIADFTCRRFPLSCLVCADVECARPANRRKRLKQSCFFGSRRFQRETELCWESRIYII